MSAIVDAGEQRRQGPLPDSWESDGFCLALSCFELP